MTFGNRLMESVETLKDNLRNLKRFKKPYSESVCNFNEDWYIKELSKLKSSIESTISQLEKQKNEKVLGELSPAPLLGASGDVGYSLQNETKKKDLK